jgi:RHS repeat-associated protein
LKAITSAYRFGFNGQEKDNQIYGSGNSYTAEFWQYDARLGRRWNVDTVDQISLSNYSCFANNPIFFIDPNGALNDDIPHTILSL